MSGETTILKITNPLNTNKYKRNDHELKDTLQTKIQEATINTLKTNSYNMLQQPFKSPKQTSEGAFIVSCHLPVMASRFRFFICQSISYSKNCKAGGYVTVKQMDILWYIYDWNMLVVVQLKLEKHTDLSIDSISMYESSQCIDHAHEVLLFSLDCPPFSPLVPRPAHINHHIWIVFI